MIIVKLQGGLGNQMFQYAAAKSLCAKGPVYFDISFLNTQTKPTHSFTPRKFELSVFKHIKHRTISNTMVQILKSNTVFCRLLKTIFLIRTEIICQSEKNEFINLKTIKSSSVYLDGYFQSEDYFKSIREQLLSDFQFPGLNETARELENEIAASGTAVGVHVRRGDYLKPDILAYHGVLPLAYYQQAKREIESSVTNPHYFVFSDDPEWCRSNFSFLGSNAKIVSQAVDNAWTDMYLMSLCKHHIIANSSYSWWAAWLNKNPEKLVVAPKNWFASIAIEIVPSKWKKI